MRRVSNEQLATAITIQRMQEGPYLIQRLGRSRHREMSPVRKYQEFHYYVFGDGSSESLVVSPSEDRLYAPLLGLHLGEASLDEKGALRVGIAGRKDPPDILAADLVFGDPRDRVPGQVRPTEVVVGLPGPEPSMSLGSIGLIEVTFRRFERVLSTALPLPFVDADAVLAPMGLAIRPTDDGFAYVFRNDPSAQRLERIADLVRSRLVPSRFVDVIGRLDDEHGTAMRRISISGCDLLIVDVRGYRHVIRDSPQRLQRMDRAEAVAVAEALQLDATPKPHQGPVRARVQPAGQALRRGTTAMTMRALGFERYQKARLAIQSARTPLSPYQSYAQNVDFSTALAGTVLVDGYNGKAFDGSLLAIARECAVSRPDLTWTIAAPNRPGLAERLARYGIRAKTVARSSQEYYDSLRTAALLLTDSALPRSYVPTRGQTLVNTGHGTPLKRMGHHIEAAPLAMANAQRTLLLSDVVAVNNPTGLQRVREAFMLDGANIRMLPSPRVSMMLELEASAASLRDQMGIRPEELVVAWLPTWRGNAGATAHAQSNLDLFTRMAAVRASTRRPMRFFAKPHTLVTDLVQGHQNAAFEMVPDHMDLYEFLTIVDVLITDYSSVTFDFALRGRPIILDVPDLEQYTAERGLYLDLAQLPFTLTRSEDEVVRALESAPSRADHAAFNEEYNPLESPGGTQTFLGSVLGGDPEPEPAAAPARERILIFPGSLKTNGITTSFLNLLSHLGDERDYEILLPVTSVSGHAGDNLHQVLASGHRCIVAPRGTMVAPSEQLAWAKFEHRLELDEDDWNHLEAVFRREARRLFGRRSYDQAIHFSGYDALPAGVLALTAPRSHVFIHSDMGHELELRNNFNAPVLRRAYQRARTIPVVSDALRTDLVTEGYLPESIADRIRVVHNTLDLDSIVRRSKAHEAYLTPELVSILEDESSTRFVNIGRFSPEKGQDRLIRAFEEVCLAEPHRTFQLFLIGGPGNSRAKLYGMRDHSPVAERIHLFENINPMPILARCDLFVQSSLYEGFGIALLEAIALGVPVLSTRLPGPQEFLESGYGYVVDNSTEGLVAGMTDFVRGKLPPVTRSLEDYNRQAVAEFFAVLD